MQTTHNVSFSGVHPEHHNGATVKGFITITTPLHSSRYDQSSGGMTSDIHTFKRMSPGPYSFTQLTPDGSAAYSGHLYEGWQKLIHPDGKPYFYHKQLRIVTEVNIQDPLLHRSVRDFHSSIISSGNNFRHLYTNMTSTEMYITLQPNGYYIADHHMKQIWWLQSVHLERLFKGDNIRTYSPTTFDNLSSRISTAPWSPSEAKITTYVYYARILYKWGSQSAVLDYTQTIDVPSTNAIDYIVGIFSFYASSTYLKRLHTTRAGGVTSFVRWKAMVESLLAEWSDSNLLCQYGITCTPRFVQCTESMLYNFHIIFHRKHSITFGAICISLVCMVLHFRRIFAGEQEMKEAPDTASDDSHAQMLAYQTPVTVSNLNAPKFGLPCLCCVTIELEERIVGEEQERT
ncbi:hypothetical protein BDQ12DRAFT_667139 [Crucibulum laeve]|uniref:Uncharacterized protein n=1 Tax=Crucibulum laeve TaxID=68775 RepID=A0A5C3LWL6_9AGAR|nr:hypothetical protein BDQ12DRAFT_667139 [Crucibulum laeve]